MSPQDAPFYRFQGWRLLVLIIVGVAYSYWFTVLGPYSKLAGLAPGMPLEETGYYSGEHAVNVLGSLDAEGRQAKYTSILFDIPYMILLALMFEGLIGFGRRHMKLNRPVWRLLFILPIAFLLMDFAEDSCLALTLASGSEITGTLAGFFTLLKFITFSIVSLTAFVCGIGGLIAWLMSKHRTA